MPNRPNSPYAPERTAEPTGSEDRGRLVKPILKGIFLLGSIVWTIAFCVVYFHWGYNNFETPAGFAGYITRGSIFSKSEFVGIQYGETSTGAGWLVHGTNIPITPRTFEEDFRGDAAIVGRDNGRIDFAVDIQWRVKTGDSPFPSTTQPASAGKPVFEDWVKIFVEQYSTLHPGDSPETILRIAYDNNIRRPIQNIIRVATEKKRGMAVQDTDTDTAKQPGTDIQSSMKEIKDEIVREVAKVTANTPFEVMQVNIGRLHYQQVVTDRVTAKLVREQEKEQEDIGIQIATKDAEINVIENEGFANAAQIINRSMQPRWLQWQAIQAMREVIKSPTPTHIYITVGPMGVPVVNGLRVTDSAGKALPLPEVSPKALVERAKK